MLHVLTLHSLYCPPGVKPPQERQLILVANAHMHWDPEYSDVKLVQTMMFLSELKSIAESASVSAATGSTASDPSSIPIVLCADLNSLPDSGTPRCSRRVVYIYMCMYVQDCLRKLEYCDKVLYFL